MWWWASRGSLESSSRCGWWREIGGWVELSGYKKNLEEVYKNHTYITKKEKRLWQAEQKFLFVQLHIGKIPYALDKWKVIFGGFASFHLLYHFYFVIHRNRNVYDIFWWMQDAQPLSLSLCFPYFYQVCISIIEVFCPTFFFSFQFIFFSYM